MSSDLTLEASEAPGTSDASELGLHDEKDTSRRDDEAGATDEPASGAPPSAATSLAPESNHEPRTFTSPLDALLDVPEACIARPSAETCCTPTQTLTTGTDSGEAFTWSQLSLVSRCVDARGGDDVVKTGARADVLLGGDGNDELEGRTGADWLLGGDGADLLHAGAGVDVLLGGEGDDELRGGIFADALVGGPGSDTIRGGQGNDFVWPGAGIDDVEAGFGSDTVVIVARCEVEAGEVLDGGPGYDVLRTVVPLADLEAAGVLVTGFEAVQVVPEVPEFTPDCGFLREDALPDDETPLANLPAIESVTAQQVELVRSFLTDLQPIPPTGCEPIAVEQPAYPLDTTGDGYVYDSRPVVDLDSIEVESGDQIALGERRVQLRSPSTNPTDSSLQFGTYRVTSTTPRVDETLDDGRQKIVSTRGFVLDDDSSYLHWVTRYRPGAAANGLAFDTEQLTALLQEDEQARGRPIAIGMWGNRENPNDAGIEISYIRDGKSYPSAVVAGLNLLEFQLILAARRAQGFRPISIAVSGSARNPWYSAIFVDDPVAEEDWAISFDHDGVSGLESATAQRLALGFVPMQVVANRKRNGSTGFTVLWIRRPLGMSVRGQADLNDFQLTENDVAQRRAGYSLRSMSTYTSAGGALRHVAIWERYADVWREDGDGFAAPLLDPGAPAEVSLIAAIIALPVDNAFRGAFRTAALAPFDGVPMNTDTDTVIDPGQRSIATQASITILFQGDPLYRKAYTLAPSVHPTADTNTVFRVGSVSKSVTGAATLKLLGEAFPGLGSPQNAHVQDFVPGLTSLGSLRFRDLLQHYSPWGNPEDVPYLGDAAADCSDAPLSLCTPTNTGGVWKNPVFSTLPFASALGRVAPLDANDIVDFVVDEGDPFASSAPFDEYSNLAYMVVDAALSPVASTLGYDDFGDYIEDEMVAAAGVGCRLRPARATIEEHRTEDARLRSSLPSNRDTHPIRNVPASEVERRLDPYESSNFKATARGDTQNFASIRAVSEPYGASYDPAQSILAAGGWAGSTLQLARLFREIWREDGAILDEEARDTLVSPCGSRTTNPRVITGREDFSHYGQGSYVYGPWLYASGTIPGGAALLLYHRQWDITIALTTNAEITLSSRVLDALDVSCKEIQSTTGPGPNFEYFSIFPCEDEVYSCEDGTERTIACPEANTFSSCPQEVEPLP